MHSSSGIGHTEKRTILLLGEHRCAEGASQVGQQLTGNFENMSCTDEQKKETFTPGRRNSMMRRTEYGRGKRGSGLLWCGGGGKEVLHM